MSESTNNFSRTNAGSLQGQHRERQTVPFSGTELIVVTTILALFLLTLIVLVSSTQLLEHPSPTPPDYNSPKAMKQLLEKDLAALHTVYFTTSGLPFSATYGINHTREVSIFHPTILSGKGRPYGFPKFRIFITDHAVIRNDDRCREIEASLKNL